MTLNGVLGSEPSSIAISTTFLLRRALEEARSFEAGVELLRSTTVAADCLLLVTGAGDGEMVVVERTSTRAALRRPEAGALCVTNDYRALSGEAVTRPESELVRTGGSRYVAATELAQKRPPADAESAFAILDARVRMGITRSSTWCSGPGPASSRCACRRDAGGPAGGFGETAADHP